MYIIVWGCGKSGSVIDLVMLKERVDTAEAIRILKERYGPPPPILLKKKTPTAPKFGDQKAAEIDITDTKYQIILKRLFDYFCAYVKQNSYAL